MFFKKHFFKIDVSKSDGIFFSQKRGFTLIELLTSLTIISIMTAMVFANPHSARQQLALQRSAYQVSQAVRKAEGLGISSLHASQCSGKVPKGGYGIYFSSSSSSEYTIFADCNGNGIYDKDEGEGVITSSLEKHTFISSLSPDSPLTILFIPPDPEVIIKYGSSNETTTDATTTLGCQIDPNLKVKVHISNTGLVYVVK